MFDAGHLRKPLHQLRKLLKGFPSIPSQKQVHALRTEARRLEAVLLALGLTSNRDVRRLLKLMTPLRKAAGHVRDMDVLIADVLSLCETKYEVSAVQFIEQLSRMRLKYARKLAQSVDRRGKEARIRLKRCSRLLQARLREQVRHAEAPSAPQILATELRHWPRLDSSNLHSFRIRVKELSNILQLFQNADSRTVQRLIEVKDSIGEWHDWQELNNMAGKFLNSQDDRALLRRIESIQLSKLRKALARAGELHKQYFASGHRSRGISS
jgi:CHAD domain-containing protein